MSDVIVSRILNKIEATVSKKQIVIGGDTVKTITKVVSNTGNTGGTGEDGNSVLSGSGSPTSETGTDGDFYIDTDVYNIYGPKYASSWGAGTSLVGPAGADGAQGPEGADGADGADGATWLSGTGAPSNGLGDDGDFYMDTDASTWYGPKASGTWPAGVSTGQGIQSLEVVNINDPSTELNALAGSIGDMVLCYQVLATTNVSTLYVFDASDSGSEFPPFTVDALTSGVWVASGGRYTSDTLYPFGLSLGGHAVSDIAISTDAAGSSDTKLITEGYFNAHNGGGGPAPKKAWFSRSIDQVISNTSTYIEWDTTTDFPVDADGHVTGFEAGKSYLITVCIQGAPTPGDDLTQFVVYNHTTSTELSKRNRVQPEGYSSNRHTALSTITYIYTPVTASDEIGVKCVRLDTSNYSVEESTTSMSIVEIASSSGGGGGSWNFVDVGDANHTASPGDWVLCDNSVLTDDFKTVTGMASPDANDKFRITIKSHHATYGRNVSLNGETAANDPMVGLTVDSGTHDWRSSPSFTIENATPGFQNTAMVVSGGSGGANGVLTLPYTYKSGSKVYGIANYHLLTSAPWSGGINADACTNNQLHLMRTAFNGSTSTSANNLVHWTTEIKCPDGFDRLVNTVTLEFVYDGSEYHVSVIAVN